MGNNTIWPGWVLQIHQLICSVRECHCKMYKIFFLYILCLLSTFYQIWKQCQDTWSLWPIEASQCLDTAGWFASASVYTVNLLVSHNFLVQFITVLSIYLTLSLYFTVASLYYFSAWFLTNKLHIYKCQLTLVMVEVVELTQNVLQLLWIDVSLASHI